MSHLESKWIFGYQPIYYSQISFRTCIIFSKLFFEKVLIHLAMQSESKKISVNSTISLKGIVKAIFNDTVHVQIGGKIITLPVSEFLLEKPVQ
jgi:hypothetical protein